MSEETQPDQPNNVRMLRKDAFTFYRERKAEYRESVRSLRIWFLAYAVGGPAVLVSKGEALAIVLCSKWSVLAVILFFLAIVIQVIGEIYHKKSTRRTMLAILDLLYTPANFPGLTSESMPTRYFAKFNTITGDICTFICLALATIMVISILLAHSRAASPVPPATPLTPPATNLDSVEAHH